MSSTISTATGRGEDPFRILLATDDSESARCAEDWAVRLTTNGPRLVEIVCVARPGLSRLGWAMESYRPEVKHALEQSRETELLLAERTANTVGDRLQARGLRVHAWARHGEPIDELLEMIDVQEPDLVAVGHRGRSALNRMLLGSVSHQLVLDSPRPVLVARLVPDGSAPLPQRALVVLSGSRADLQTTHWLARSGLLQASHVTALSVVDELSPEAPSLLAELDARIREEIDVRASTALAPLEGATAALDHAAISGHPAQQVLLVADREQSDLIVVSRPALRRGRRSLAEEIAHQAPCAVLVCPAG